MSLGKEEARSILDQPQVRRLVFNHDKICFKHCIKTPGKNLSPSDEQCLSTYFIRISLIGLL